MDTRIVGLGGSLAEHSNSLAALKIALEGAEQVGAETTLFNVRTLDFPMYSPDLREPPPKVRTFVHTVEECDGMIWSSPLYQGTISGSFKNAIDWLQLLSQREPPYLTDRVIGMVSTAGGTQGLQAVNTMEFIARALRAWAVPLVIPIPRAWKAFDEEGAVRDHQVEAQLRALGGEVTRAATVAKEARERAEPMTTVEAARVQTELEPQAKQ